MVTLAALFAAAAAYATYCSFAAFRWGERKRFWLFLGATFPLTVLAIALLWVGIGYPRLNERLAGNMGFGPEWNCSSDASGAGVCLRKSQPQSAKLQLPAEPKTP
jgi:hypothetical protein